MANLTFPSTDPFLATETEFGPIRMVRGSGVSPLSVNEQFIELPYSHRWVQIVVLAPSTPAQRAQIEGEAERWINPDNRVLLWHLGQPAPNGTMRGSPTLNGAHSQGATSLVLASAGANATILRGDMLGVTTSASYNIQLVRVVADATANGSGAVTVSIEPALRASASGGAAIVWDKPKAMWRPRETRYMSRYMGSTADTFRIEFIEVVL
jgi:hypothetical protein